jgi:S-formylglutathione hydrolase FrmB
MRRGMRVVARTLALVGLLAAGLVPTLPKAEAATSACPHLASPSALVVGTPGCFSLPSGFMGADVPVSYFVPPACAPATGADCPVLYYLHGTGGSYLEGVGSADKPSRWVHALTKGPPVDQRTVAEPWKYADVATWVKKAPLDMILVSPDGRTQLGGYGPAPGLDTGWFDWNPRYARGGDTPRYATPAPRPSSFLTDELVPFVDHHFPTVAKRQWRAILGYSQGGFGSYINGLTRPDLFASMGMESGGALPLVSVGDLVDDRALVTGVAPLQPLPFVRLPGLVNTLTPLEVLSFSIVGELTLGFGDAIADQAWMRASNPIDLVPNARAFAADGRQANHLKHFVNDAIPRRVEDVAELSDDYMSQVYESVLFPSDLYLEHVLDRYGVQRTFNIGPGQHGYPYQSPYFREQLVAQYAHLQHADGNGHPMPDPVVFDYRTVRTSFPIWGWTFRVGGRPAVEFLNLTNVSCDGLTLRGTGRVTVTPATSCGTGLDGHRTFTVDLGPSAPIDEPAGAGTSHAYGVTKTVKLTPL